MRKLYFVSPLAFFLVIVFSFIAFSGEWKFSNYDNKWWYDNGDGTYPYKTWKWIDGDNDGFAERYYFDCNGFLATDTQVYGEHVNANGEWNTFDRVVTERFDFANDYSSKTGKWEYHTTSSAWFYHNDDDTYPTRSWEWIDGDHDGISECYYFDGAGALVTNDYILDAYVNTNGAWEINGVVQTIETGSIYSNCRPITQNDSRNQSVSQTDISQADNTKSYQSNNGYKISAPLDDKFGGFCYGKNIADGIKVNWRATNNTGKTINYYTLVFSIDNPVGDLCIDQITRLPLFIIKFVGPVKPGEELLCHSVIGYTSAPHTVRFELIKLVYNDGTEELIDYRYSTSEHKWYLDK